MRAVLLFRERRCGVYLLSDNCCLLHLSCHVVTGMTALTSATEWDGGDEGLYVGVNTCMVHQGFLFSLQDQPTPTTHQEEQCVCVDKLACAIAAADSRISGTILNTLDEYSHGGFQQSQTCCIMGIILWPGPKVQGRRLDLLCSRIRGSFYI